MAKAKQPAKTPLGTKNPSLTDVAKPGKSSPSPTSRPVIVTHRPILKDPMVNHEDEAPKADKPTLKAPSKRAAELESLTMPKLPVDAEETTDEPTNHKDDAPSKDSIPEPKKETADPTPEDKEDDKVDASDNTVPTPPLDAKAAQPGDEDEAVLAAQEKHDASVQKLIENKKYFLPINSVEKRRAKHTLVLGVGVSVLLLLAWANIALDAGLISIDGVEPLTHFFST